MMPSIAQTVKACAMVTIMILVTAVCLRGLKRSSGPQRLIDTRELPAAATTADSAVK
jgi:hypothetical protein